jgi:hypothetical protein
MNLRCLKALEKWKAHFMLIMPVPRLRGPRLPVARWVQCELFPGFAFERRPTKFYHSCLETLWRKRNREFVPITTVS